jgi:hypothetical protein
MMELRWILGKKVMRDGVTGSPRELSQLNLGSILFIKAAHVISCLQIYKIKFCMHFLLLQHLLHIPLISPFFIFFHFIAKKMFNNDFIL